MVPRRLVSGLTACAILSPVFAAPSPESVGSDVSILLHNDLRGTLWLFSDSSIPDGNISPSLCRGNHETHTLPRRGRVVVDCLFSFCLLRPNSMST